MDIGGPACSHRNTSIPGGARAVPGQLHIDKYVTIATEREHYQSPDDEALWKCLKKKPWLAETRGKLCQ